MSEREEKYTLYGGDVELLYNDDEHVYRYKGRKVPSTTQITKVIEKSVLLFWAVKVQAEYLEKQWRSGVAYPQKTIQAILKRSKYQHKVESEKATTIGTQAHFWIETFVNMSLEQSGGTAWPDGWEKIPLPDSIEGIRSCNAFINWYNDNEVIFHASERKIYSLIHNYSGTLDLDATVNGIRGLVDFKTSKAMYEDYYIQLAGYANAVNEEIDYLIKKTRSKKKKAELEAERPLEATVLRVPKDGAPYETGTIVVESPLCAAYFSLFEASRVIYNWQEKFTDEWQAASAKPVTKKGKKKDMKVYLPFI